MRPTVYAPHAALTTPGKPKSELWRLVLGLMLAAFVMFGLSRGVLVMVNAFMSEDRARAFGDALMLADTPAALLIVLVLMGAMGIGAIVAGEVLHNRPARSLFGPTRLFGRQFARVLVALAALNLVVALLPPWPLSMATEPGLPFDVWVMLLPLTLGALLIQVGSEELLFRGYFQSQLAARINTPLVWLTIPSALFALGHYAPDIYGNNAPYVALWAFAFGVAAADLTARSGSLGPAIALHLVNNFLALGVMSLQGQMSGLALMKLPFGPDDEPALAAFLPVDLVMMGVSWLAARLALRV